MELTLEFKDFYNVDFGRPDNLQSQLSLDETKSNIERVRNIVKSFNDDHTLLEEYLKNSDKNEVLCTIYIFLQETGDITNDLKSVLLKYTDELRAIKEYNKPSLSTYSMW